ncbi:MAG: choice-of-anchor Q domain-containing protein [Candidatus Binatia bacterium]
MIASDDSTVNIYNNIVRSNTATGDGDDISLFDDLDLNNIGSTINLFNNNFSDFFSFCDADDVDPCTPDIAQGSNIDVDPLFADAPNGDIHLQTGSPAINTGTAAAPSLPTTDFEGDQRIFGSAPDIGADESTTVVAVCGDDIVDSGEDCDDGNTENGDCCSATCDFESADTVCRAASGACDVAEMCTGTSADCPADGFASATTECRPATGVCDIADTCTGTSAECPAADLKSVAECRPTGGACDVAESCDGVGNECPADNFVAAGTECRASAGACDIAETCSGTAATCPADGFASVGTACGDVGTECTNQDSCNGSGSCTDQGFKASGTACGDAGNTDCNNPDTCNGAGNCQDNFEPGGTACTSDGSQCTQDLCNDMGSCTHPAAPVVCGNGCVEAGEECDDGNTDPGDGCSDMCQTETPPEAHDLATLGIKAPGTITLTAAKPTQTRTVTVSIQNRSPHPETIEPALVSLTVLSLGSCPNPTPVLGAGQLPVTLAPKQKVDVAFDVAFDCANDPLKSSKKDPDHKDYSYTATVNHAALGGALDSHPADDTCPRDALGLDPNPDGTITDKGCPEAKTTVTDVVMK